MPKVTEHTVSLLSSSKHGLRYLTANDWTLIGDKAGRAVFRKGQVMVQRGVKADGIYLLLQGRARVQFPSQTVSRTIGPGEVCGEMSFLEDQSASATVVAEGAVETYHLDRASLESLFELFPHLASRFYRSLAANLSHRLRDLIDAGSARAKD
jgi:CRP-like cAMP-binding protein